MYSTQAVSRPEISAFVEQAKGAERFYIAQRIFPVLGRKARAGRYPVIKTAKGNLMKREQTKRGSSGAYNETTQEHVWDTYDCQDRGLEQRVDDTKAEEMADFFQLERLAAANVTKKCKLDFEIAAAAKIQDEGTFTKQDAVVAYTEGNKTTIDFPQDVQGAVEEVTGRGERVNTIIIPHQVFNRLTRTTLLQEYLYGTLGNSIKKRMISPKDLADAFNLDATEEIQVIIGRAKYDTAAKGRTTASLTSIWANTHIWVGHVCGGEFDAGGAGRTLVWNADVPSGLFATETYRDEKRRSDMVRVRTNSVEKVVNENCGHLIKTNWA